MVMISRITPYGTTLLLKLGLLNAVPGVLLLIPKMAFGYSDYFYTGALIGATGGIVLMIVAMISKLLNSQ